MKIRVLLAILAVFSLVGVAHAQETYSVQAPAGAVSDITGLVDVDNAKTCERLSKPSAPLVEGCTQAAACTNAGAAGGSSCTAVQARAANARIYPNTLAGREEYVTFSVVVVAVQDKRANISARNQDKRCKFWVVATGPQRQAICTANGLPSSCDLSCPGY
jgi:hypothetical protein